MIIPALPNFSLGGDTAAVDQNSRIAMDNGKPVLDANGKPVPAPDYAKAKAEGVSFMYFKRSQHVYPDAYYAQDSDRARKAGLVVGAYLFPGWGPTAATAKAQVSAFKAAGGEIIKGLDLPPAIDVESGGSSAWSKVGRPFIVEQVRQLAFEVEDQLGVSPALYSSFMQWWDLGLPNAAWMSKLALWIKTAYPVEARQPIYQVAPPAVHFGGSALDPRSYYQAPDAWKDVGWAFRQIQGDASNFPGHDKTVDVDIFNDLREGMKDPFVGWMQGKLIAWASATKATGQTALTAPADGGPYRPLMCGAEPVPANALTVDNDFGPTTATWLNLFKAICGMPTDAHLDPATFAALWWA